jgi:hypothetical protein
VTPPKLAKVELKQEGLAGNLPTGSQELFQEFLDWSSKQPK